MKIKMMNKESQKALNFFQIERLKSAYMDEWKDTEITSEDLSMFARLYTGTNEAAAAWFAKQGFSISLTGIVYTIMEG